ncbi:hypothetical protein [Streptomyces platensis]|uniref:hypothetical protein n=1 Tax=Streptomyces platensis TaxID=58346 RepID=UPI00386EAFDE|nr:hypothetical protein OG962_27215 [Streptomyces platensis]
MTTWRLNPTDEMLHAAEETLGSSRVVQVLWKFPHPASRRALEAEWHRLNQSRLSRRAAPARLPAARRRWVRATNEEPLHTDQQVLTGATASQWIDEQVRAPMPVGSTALWRLASAPYEDGSLVSLTVPHFRCDGMGIFHAIATRGTGSYAHPTPADEGADGDLGEALGQVLRACTGTARWGLNLLAGPGKRAQLGAALGNTAARPAAAGSAPRFFSSALFDVPAADWERQARAHGGTANSLFIEIAANLIRRNVPRDQQATVDVGIPMSVRAPEDDGRANALVVLPLTVPGGSRPHLDLRHTRTATRELLQTAGEHSGTLVPEPLWHLLPARWADRLKAPGAQQTDVVASNFGTAPEPVARFGGGLAESVGLRTMNVPGLVPEKARLRASLCLLRVGERMTVTVTGIPDHFGDVADLSSRVTEELAAWGLTGRQWWTPISHEA